MNRQLTSSTAYQITTTDTGIRLLKARTAHRLLDFFYNVFTVRGVTAVPQLEFEELLKAYIKDTDAELELEEDIDNIDSDISETTEDERIGLYLAAWLNRGYIKRDVTVSGNMIRLDLDVSRLLNTYITAILDSREGWFATKAGYRAIESSLSDIKTTLLAETKEQRVAEIEKEMRALQEEKEGLLSGRITFSPASNLEITTALENVKRQMVQFKYSFTELDAAFKGIIRKSMVLRAKAAGTKAEMFDAQHYLFTDLCGTPQYKDFDSFLLSVQSGTPDTIRDLSIDIMTGLQKRGIFYELSGNLRFKEEVLGKALDVSDNYRRYYRGMYRTLRGGHGEEFIGITEALKDCRQALLQLREKQDVLDKVTVSFERTEVEVNSALLRPLQFTDEEEKKPVLNLEIQQEIPLDMEELQAFRDSSIEIDRGRLESNIESIRAKHNGEEFSLGDVIREHPLKQDLAELVEYIIMAMEERGEKAFIPDEREQVTSDTKTGRYTYGLPKVVYR